VSNIFFWREYGSYFASNAAEAPLLHTWSLGVEEQFYFIWPILLFVLHRWLNPIFVFALLLIIIVSFGVSEYGSRVAASASYYLMPTRFYELMMGGVLFVLSCRYQPASARYSMLAFVLGFGLIVGSLYWIDKSSSFPGLTALWPCFGAILIIWSGLKPTALNKILMVKPVVFVGLISYSMYLWHWPIISYLNYLDVKIDYLVGFCIFLSVLFLSWFSLRFVEAPMRRTGAKMDFWKVALTRFSVPTMLLISISVIAIKTNGFSARFPPEVALMEASQSYKPNVLRAGCHVPTALYKSELLPECKIGTKKKNADGILIGDSFANHFTGMLDVMAKQDDISLNDYTMDACPPILGFDNGLSREYSTKCVKRNELAYKYVEENNYQYVVLASDWPEQEIAGHYLSSSIEKIRSAGAKVIIIMRSESIVNANTCVIRNAMYGRNNDCNQDPRGQPAYFANIQQQYPDIHFVDPNIVICKSGLCGTTIDGTLIFRDSSHLNDIGSRLLGEKLLLQGITLTDRE